MTKQIGDTLTDKELNTIQTLLHANQIHTEQITLQNTINTPYGTVNVKYGNEYYKRKSGIITNNLQIKITDPLLPILSYELTLTYKSLNNDLLDNDDNITETVTYNIPIDQYVTITEGTLEHIIYYTLTLTIRPQTQQTQKLQNITITTNKTHIHTGETLTITGQVHTDQGTIIGDEDIDIYTDNQYTTTITMTNKKATYNYTGTGAKAHKITFKTKNNTQITQDTTVKDCFFDNNTFYNHNNNIEITTDGTLTYNGNTWGGYFADTTGTATTLAQCIQYNRPFAFEFDIHQPQGICYIQIYGNSDTYMVQRRFTSLSTKKKYHVRVEVLTDSIRYYVDDEYKSSLTWTGEMPTCRVGFRLNNGSSLKFTDFYMYNL